MNLFPKVLVVDDEPDIVEILRYNLQKQKFSVLTASNGNEALEIALVEIPDLIILDVRMPGMTGIETCRKMRTFDSLKDILVLFLTADTDEYTSMSAIEAGGNHFITKPIHPTILLNMIKEMTI